MNHSSLSRHSAVVCLAASALLAGCHKKVAATVPPPPPAAVAPAPTAQISVSPAAVTPGQSAKLTWSTANATTASIAGLGTVAASGSRSIAPSASTDYTLTAKGPGGSVQQTARLTVNPAPPSSTPIASMTEEQLFEKNMSDTYFDYDKYTLRPHGTTVAQQDAAFLAKHPDIKILIAGHCDERGSEEYNIALGENRAQSLQKALANAGVPAASIRVVSYGKEKPFCTESNDQCWQQNRRDHLSLDR
jgi:peptidoglycan-associated lipoprotein